MGRTGLTKFILVLFILWLVLTIFLMSFGLIYVLNPEYKVKSYVTESGTHVTIRDSTDTDKVALYVCTPVNLIITFLLFYYWKARSRRDKQVEELPSYIKMYRRVRLEEIAQRMGISMKELDSVLKECEKRGYVNGHVDGATGEFVMAGADYLIIPDGLACRNCGALIDGKFLVGEVVKCSFCNVVIPPEERRPPSR